MSEGERAGPVGAGGEPRRLNWGCGASPAPGWINSDLAAGPSIDIACDILEGLPLADASLDYISSQHALPELRIYDQLPALEELRRVLKPGGVLRLCLPDMDRAIDAYRERRQDYFHVWYWASVAGNFITHVLWYGYTRTPFTYEFAAELLDKAGFRTLRRVAYQRTAGPWPEIVELDTRPDESFYVEAFK